VKEKDQDFSFSNFGQIGFGVGVCLTNCFIEYVIIRGMIHLGDPGGPFLAVLDFPPALMAVIGIVALLFQTALGFGLVVAFSSTSRCRALAAKIAFRAGIVPWIIFSLPMLPIVFIIKMPLDSLLGSIFAICVPLTCALGQYLGFRYVLKTAPPPVEVIQLSMQTLGELDQSLVQLLEARSLDEAKHRAHACMAILGTSCDPSSDEALTLLPERLMIIDRVQSAMAISDLHIRLSEES
jgi:hypothetical protein